MRGTGQFEIQETTIQVGYNTPISIVFFGDVHKGAPLHCADVWQEFIQKYKDRKDTYFIGMGDYLDLLSASERLSWKRGDYHESTEETMEEVYCKKIDAFGEDILWMRGKLLGMIEGNHHIRFSDGTTTAMKLCQKLGAAYLGDCAIYRIYLKSKGSNQMSFNIALHHGIGGGKTTGSMFNSLDHMATVIDGCSIYAMGDNHQRGAVPTQRLYLSLANKSDQKPKIKCRDAFLVRTGSFLGGYKEGKASYVTDKLMRPANLGSIRIDVTFARDNKHGVYDETFIKMEAIT